MNVLLLSIGAKRALVEAFRNSSSSLRVITTDCSPYAAGLYASDAHYIVPLMHSNEYIPALLDICRKEQISVIVPLNEEELFVISENRNQFEALGILINLSSIDVLKICKDKLLFSEVMGSNGIPHVNTIKLSDYKEGSSFASYPLMAKPQNGAASIGNTVINSFSDFDRIPDSMKKNYILQPYLEGIEYGVDVYVDFISGEIIQIFMKEKISMRNGETEKSKAVFIDEIADLVKQVVNAVKPKGVIDFDILYANNQYSVLEVNPRFGGGYSHAALCGVDYPAFLATNASGKTNTPCIGNYPTGSIALKYSATSLI